jgi:hypothetical protein
MIKKCVCKHDWQDKVYGLGMRVANEKKDGSYRCTACGKDILSIGKDKK